MIRPGKSFVILAAAALLVVRAPEAESDEFIGFCGYEFFASVSADGTTTGVLCPGRAGPPPALDPAIDASAPHVRWPQTAGDGRWSCTLVRESGAGYGLTVRQQLAISGCCKERRTPNHAWRRSRLAFAECKRRNDRIDRDDVFAPRGLYWWDIGC